MAVNAPRRLANCELVVVTGKGGVGKSTLAAALGTAAAADGATLILDVDPRESIHRLLDVAPSAGEIRRAAPDLFLQSLRGREVLDRIIAERLRIRALSRRVLDSPIYRHFAEGAPGLKEMAILWQALRLVRGDIDGAPALRRVVLDAPATGHGLSLLLAPVMVSEVVDRGPIAEMTREVADWVRSARGVGVVVVTLAEEMPVTEALELQRDLAERLDRGADAVVVNGLYPELSAARQPADEIGRLWWRRRRLNEAELERLAKGGRAADLELPLVASVTGRDLVANLAPYFHRLLAEPAG